MWCIASTYFISDFVYFAAKIAFVIVVLIKIGTFKTTVDCRKKSIENLHKFDRNVTFDSVGKNGKHFSSSFQKYFLYLYVISLHSKVSHLVKPLPSFDSTSVQPISPYNVGINTLSAIVSIVNTNKAIKAILEFISKANFVNHAVVYSK